MKRGITILSVLISLITLINLNFISAQISLYEGMTEVWNNISLILTPILTFFLGDVSGALLLNKILILIIVTTLIWIGMEKISLLEDKNKIIKIVLTFAVSILAMKGIGSSETINMILVPYTATGVALSAGFPFVIYFFLINKGIGAQSTTLRRTAWIFFAVIFLGLLTSRIGGIENIFNPSKWGFYWIYFVASFLAIGMAILDGTIKAFFLNVEADKLKNINKAKILSKIINRKNNYERIKTEMPEEYELLMKQLRKELKFHGIKRRI
jgi:hypothetical protein